MGLNFEVYKFFVDATKSTDKWALGNAFEECETDFLQDSRENRILLFFVELPTISYP